MYKNYNARVLLWRYIDDICAKTTNFIKHQKQFLSYTCIYDSDYLVM